MPRGSFDRSEKRARTRSRLLDAAGRVYSRRGFDAATLDEVAEEAGFTKGAVYDHFGSKERLLFALLDEHLVSQIEEQMTLFDSSLQTNERPLAGADRWMEELEEDPDAFRLFVEAWLRGQRDEELRKLVVDGMDAWRATLREFGAARAGEIGAQVPEPLFEALANLMLALGTGLGLLKLADPESVSPRLLGAAFVILLHAVESSEEARALLLEAAGERVRP
jgi:AcrR family transcriptional regulator